METKPSKSGSLQALGNRTFSVSSQLNIQGHMLPLLFAFALLFKIFTYVVTLSRTESTTTIIKNPSSLSPSFAFHTVYTGHDFTHAQLIADDSD